MPAEDHPSYEPGEVEPDAVVILCAGPTWCQVCGKEPPCGEDEHGRPYVHRYPDPDELILNRAVEG
jgi:hypothetical protein